MITQCHLTYHYNPPLTYPACNLVICPVNQTLIFTMADCAKVVMFSQFFTGPVTVPLYGQPVVSLVLNPYHPNTSPGEFLLEMHFYQNPNDAWTVAHLINDIALGTFQNRIAQMYQMVGQQQSYGYAVLQNQTAQQSQALEAPPDPPAGQHDDSEEGDESEEVEDEDSDGQNDQDDADGEDPEDPEDPEDHEDQEDQEDEEDEEDEEESDEEEDADADYYVAPATPEPVIQNIARQRDGGSPPALDREPLVGLLDDGSSGDESVAPRPRQRGRQRGRRGGRRRQRRGQRQQEQRRDRERSSSESSTSSSDSSSSRDRHGNHIRRSVIEHSRVRDSTITDSVLRNCEVDNSTVRNSQISGCRINRSDCNHVRLNQ